MKLALIAAVSRNRAIGKDGKLPWHISEDLKRFKRLTTGHTVLMGRKTFESLGKPLRDRRNVVLTSHAIAGVETYRSIPEALEALREEEKVFVIGGGEIFAQTIGIADEVFLTQVERDVEGDTFFPPYEHLVANTLKLIHSSPGEGYTFNDYAR